MNYQFEHLALGGTFDFLHKGHKAFLGFAFKKARRVSIGISTDRFVAELGKDGVRPLTVRLRELKEFLEENYKKRYKIILLNDVFGTTVSGKTIDGIAVTQSTLAGADKINNGRRENGLEPLTVLTFSLICGEDNKPISSGRIKAGEIDREGRSYFSEIGGKDYFLPNELRGTIAKPHGKLLDGVSNLLLGLNGKQIVSVGDETTKNLLGKKAVPGLSIVDLKVRRKKIFGDIWDLGFEPGQKYETVSNRAGAISKQLVQTINNYFRKGEMSEDLVIKILGEDDLAVLPAVILAPLGLRVIYGQPGRGVVCVDVTEETKGKFLQILKKFKLS